MRARRALLLLSVAIALAACASIGGISDRYYAPKGPDASAGAGGSGGSAGAGASSGSSGASGSGGAAQCTANTNTDPKNCGRCGHDCLGGKCAAGQCQPITLYSGNADASTGPSYVAVNSTNVYWVQHTGAGDLMMTIAKTGGAASTVVPVGARIEGIAAEGVNVYWAAGITGDGGGCFSGACQLAIMKAGTSGASPQTLATGPLDYASTAMVVNSSSVFWDGVVPADVEYLQILRVPVTSGPISVVVASAELHSQPDSLALGSGSIYWVDGPHVVMAPLAGGTAVTIAALQAPAAAEFVADDVTGVYWTTYSNDSSNYAAVWRAPPGGSSSKDFATPIVGSPSGLVADGTNVYWSILTPGPGTPGEVLKTNESTGKTTTLATGESPAALAEDATAIYWTNKDQVGTAPYSIRKLAK